MQYAYICPPFMFVICIYHNCVKGTMANMAQYNNCCVQWGIPGGYCPGHMFSSQMASLSVSNQLRCGDPEWLKAYTFSSTLMWWSTMATSIQTFVHSDVVIHNGRMHTMTKCMQTFIYSDVVVQNDYVHANIQQRWCSDTNMDWCNQANPHQC